MWGRFCSTFCTYINSSFVVVFFMSFAAQKRTLEHQDSYSNCTRSQWFAAFVPSCNGVGYFKFQNLYLLLYLPFLFSKWGLIFKWQLSTLHYRCKVFLPGDHTMYQRCRFSSMLYCLLVCVCNVPPLFALYIVRCVLKLHS